MQHGMARDPAGGGLGGLPVHTGGVLSSLFRYRLRRIACSGIVNAEMKSRILFILLPLLSILLLTGFALDNAIVPEQEILSGGPPKDGIPALLSPKFVRPDQVDFLGPADQVIGVTIGGESKAYPLKILNWHEAVNDTLGGEPIVVTF